MPSLTKTLDRLMVTLYKFEAGWLNKRADAAAKRSENLNNRAMKLAASSLDKRREAAEVLSKVEKLEGLSE